MKVLVIFTYGYSLKTYAENTTDCKTKAYDIFEEFNGNSAKREYAQKKI